MFTASNTSLTNVSTSSFSCYKVTSDEGWHLGFVERINSRVWSWRAVTLTTDIAAVGEGASRREALASLLNWYSERRMA